jgi:hypothetical protein
MKPLILLALVALCGCGRAEWNSASEPLGVGDKIPESSPLADRTGLIWAFNAAGCLPCSFSDAARELRRLLRRHGDHLALAVVAVSGDGESDRDLVEGFLGLQRISATVVMEKPATYSAEYRRSVPVLLAVQQGVIVGVLDPYPGGGTGLPGWSVVDLLAGSQR